MKIIRTLGGGRVDVIDAEVPVPKAGEVLVRTIVSALCGSELRAYKGDGLAVGNGGHEAAGVVVELGPDVTSIEMGSRVGVSAIAGCGECGECVAGRYTWCSRRRFISSMHAEYFIVPALACQPLPADMDWLDAVLLTGDGLGVPFHSAAKLPVTTETIAIIGLGPVGLGNVLLQSYLGRRVIGVDLSAERRRMAEELGASAVIDASEAEDVALELRRLTDGGGVDVAVEAAGAPATTRVAFDSVRNGGLVVFNGEQPRVELSPSEDFIRRDVAAVGSWFYFFSEYASMESLWREGFPAASLITHRVPLESAQDAYTTMAQGKCGKIVLEYGGAR